MSRHGAPRTGDRVPKGANVAFAPFRSTPSNVDVLVVGAGPSGLSLAAQLRAFDVRFRIIERLTDRTRESRALGVQARTLELLQTIGLGEALVERGNPSASLALHIDGRRVAEVPLGQLAATDTRFPY